jgi:hypothetical protein
VDQTLTYGLQAAKASAAPVELANAAFA